MASMAVNELGPMLTATEVAEMLHLHVNTVKRLGDRRELPFYRVCKRGDRRFRLDDVMKFLAQNRWPTADPGGAPPVTPDPPRVRPPRADALTCGGPSDSGR